MNHLPQIRNCLEEIGYQADLFSDSVGLWTGQGSAALVAHSRLPKDLRTAAFAVYDGKLTDDGAFRIVRATGSALAIGVSGNHWQTCRIGLDGLVEVQHGEIGQLRTYFQKHADALNPDAVYRAKAWGRIDPKVRQLDFVDAGLMPAVEKDMGDRIGLLLEECVQDLADDLGWKNLGDTRAEEKKAEWLIQAPFWLLAAKVLRDKRVPKFTRLDLSDFDNVFVRLAKHYRSDESQAIQVPKVRQSALTHIATKIDRFASLELLSAEALGHVYESTLINKATRKKLGTHSTPPWLIDYIIGKLRPWIAEMPPEERFVFEPACGHAGFLVSALRLLDELRPAGFPEPRNPYLRKRLCGVDVDTFSQEIARLALTLADVPNPNGWNLINEDMFFSDIIQRKTQAANIILLNPPFESFGDDGQKGWLRNKAAETLRRVVENLPSGGVIGFVGPQGILQNKQGKDIRKDLLKHYEIQQVVLFADKVFEFGQPESTVILARKHASKTARTTKAIPFIRVREGEVERFSQAQEAPLLEEALVSGMIEDENFPLFVPQLATLWSHLRSREFPAMGQFAAMGQGLTHKGSGDFLSESASPFASSCPGFAGWNNNQYTHELPELSFINVDPSTFRREIMGLDAHPHILLNYAPVSRGPWRLKALIDEKGHPVTSDYLVIRPLNDTISLTVLWGILNSPIANAFAFSHLGKRHNLVGRIRLLPFPNPQISDFGPLERAIDKYLNAAHLWSAAKCEGSDHESMPLFGHAAKKKSKSSPPTEDELRNLHLRVDAEVMRLYNLPPEMERSVLDIFVDESRKGVPFEKIGYFPKDFMGLNTVSDLVTVLADWEPLAERKSELIRKKAARKASTADLAELTELKRLSAGRLDLLAPMPIAEAQALYDEVVKRTGFTAK